MRDRDPQAWRALLPLLVTLACVAALAGTTVLTTAAELPALTLRQSGHWVLARTAGAVLHVHGGTQKVDARVDVSPEIAEAGLFTLQGATQGYVVAARQAWTFDKSTLTVGAPVPLPVTDEEPVGIEVAGGPYLVYRAKGTVVRLGTPPAVFDTGGPVGMPVRTSEGTVWVHRPDTGALCAIRRDAPDIDCGLGVKAGDLGGLTVTTDRATFVDAATDTARQVRDAALSPGTAVGTDLPDDVGLADQATAARLPVLVPGVNTLRLLDSTGIPADRAAGEPLDVALGPGRFTAPVVGGEIIAVIELTASRLLTFTATGKRIADVALAPGTDASALMRGEDGRLYVDESGGTRTRIIRPDGSLGTVDLGGTRPGPGVATAPSPDQLASVAPPPPGTVSGPTDIRAAGPGPGQTSPTGQPGSGSGPVVQVPGGSPGPGMIPVPGGPGPSPGPGGPAPVAPPPGQTPAVTAPSAPTADNATAGAAGSATVSWRAGAGGAPSSYTVTGSGAAGTKNTGATSATFAGLAAGTYTFTVAASNSAGRSGAATSNTVIVTGAGPGAPQNVTGRRLNASGSLLVEVAWTAPAGGRIPASYEVTVNGQAYSGTSTVQDTKYTDGQTDGARQSNYCSPTVTYSVRAVDASGAKSDPATVTVSSAVDCTPVTVVTSATANPDGSVSVVIDCKVGGRGPESDSPIVLRFDGATKDNGNQTCVHSPTYHDLHSYTITGLQRGQTYAVTSRTTSLTGTKTSDPVSVTTP